MNTLRDGQETAEKKPAVAKFIKARRKELLILFAVALLLGVSVWGVFGKKSDGATKTASTLRGETEEKLCALLCEMDGVGEAEVMICETEDGVQSVVVVCEGANDLRVVMNIREAVAAALGTEEKDVKIYLKKD